MVRISSLNIVRTNFQLEILIRSKISARHNFRENILESSQNVSETTPWEFVSVMIISTIIKIKLNFIQLPLISDTTMKFCTCHDSTTVMASAQSHSDMMNKNRIYSKINFEFNLNFEGQLFSEMGSHVFQVAPLSLYDRDHVY